MDDAASDAGGVNVACRLGLEAVAEPGVRVNEAAVRERVLELAAQLADVDVHGAVADAELPAPDGAVEIIAGDDRARVGCAIATSSSNSRTDNVIARPVARTRPSSGWISSSPA